MISESEIAVHLNPLWRSQANFVVRAAITDAESPKKYEQLWALQLGPNRFKLCCIPYFVYDLALGDEVETSNRGESQYEVARVVQPSGHITFRAWFGDSRSEVRDELVGEMRALGAGMELYSERLLAIDAADESHAQEVADVLMAKELAGALVYETGRR